MGMLAELEVAGLIDEVADARRADAGASARTYLVLAALNRLVAPRSTLQFSAWWAATAADRFTKIGSAVLDHRRFRDAMHAVTVEQLEEISHRLAVRMAAKYRLDLSSVALDMTKPRHLH